VLRFWESKFPQLKPMKRGGGRRYYRPADVQLLRGIQHLLQTASYTIRGVQKILREEGIEDVKRIGKAQESARDERSRAAPTQGSRQLSGEKVTALHAVVAELEAVRDLLGGIREPDAAGRRSQRAVARG
jgi:DNA-binding transcriptional MerR regulator